MPNVRYVEHSALGKSLIIVKGLLQIMKWKNIYDAIAS
jgi:hypothetical protein